MKSDESKKDVDYCQLKCKMGQQAKENFICTLQHKCGKGPSCVNFKGSEVYTTDLKQLTLDWHNYYRNNVAQGKESRGSQPSASNMNELVWDKELEYIAQCHANQCIFEHDACRKSSTTGDNEIPPGQNLAQMGDTTKSNEQLIKGMIKLWYDEVALMDSSIVDEYPGTPGVGHYTQLVWAKTSRLGCGFVFRESQGFPDYSLLVCNYAEGGNLIGAKIYERGTPCSDCSGKCHPSFAGLCLTPESTSVYPDISKYAPEGYNENDIIKHGPPTKTKTLPSSAKPLLTKDRYLLLLMLPLVVIFESLQKAENFFNV